MGAKAELRRHILESQTNENGLLRASIRDLDSPQTGDGESASPLPSVKSVQFQSPLAICGYTDSGAFVPAISVFVCPAVTGSRFMRDVHLWFHCSLSPWTGKRDNHLSFHIAPRHPRGLLQ